MNELRLSRVLDKMKEQGLTQMIITDEYSIYYLADVKIAPGERFLGLYINVNGNNKIFLNKLFYAPQDLGVDKVWYSDIEDSNEIVSRYVDKNQALGIDKKMAAKFLLGIMELNSATKYVNASICVDEVRGIKNQDEIEKMIVASQINDKSMAEFKELIQEGVTEKQVSDKLLDIYVKHGGESHSFPPIVGFGANGADSHHDPDATVIKEGDSIILDVGCKKDGYCADMTRTFFYKKVSDEQRKVYELVKKANETAESMIKPGVKLCDIDKAARDIIAQAGYGEKFNHRLGHFIGIEVHDFGDVSQKNEDVAKEGMIFSIEPGVYLQDDFGVRIEDLVLVTADGCKVLNAYTKELQIIG